MARFGAASDTSAQVWSPTNNSTQANEQSGQSGIFAGLTPATSGEQIFGMSSINEDEWGLPSLSGAPAEKTELANRLLAATLGKA